MGTWSYPLFATVNEKTPDDYVITVADLSAEDIQGWKHAAFFHLVKTTTGWEEQPTWTLTEFMRTYCDSHKLMDHMDNATIQLWLNLFAYLHGKYPSLSVRFHFFCSDSNEPYYFSVDKTSPKTLLMCVGQSESQLYMVPDAKGEREFKFVVAKYAHRWKDASFRCLSLRINPLSLW